MGRGSCPQWLQPLHTPQAHHHQEPCGDATPEAVHSATRHDEEAKSHGGNGQSGACATTGGDPTYGEEEECPTSGRRHGVDPDDSHIPCIQRRQEDSADARGESEAEGLVGRAVTRPRKVKKRLRKTIQYSTFVI